MLIHFPPLALLSDCTMFLLHYPQTFLLTKDSESIILTGELVLIEGLNLLLEMVSSTCVFVMH